MQLPLEDLEYQQRAVDTVVQLFAGQGRNTFDNANVFGIQTNVTNLSADQLQKNKCSLIEANGLTTEAARLSDDKDICLELALDTTKKWNLKRHLGEKLKAF
jgi:type III restriction enzyme